MIEQMNHIGQLWWSWMGPMFWQVSVLIVLIGAIDLLLRRWAWPQVRYASWLLVLVKLVLPPGLSLPTSVTSPFQPWMDSVINNPVSEHPQALALTSPAAPDKNTPDPHGFIAPDVKSGDSSTGWASDPHGLIAPDVKLGGSSDPQVDLPPNRDVTEPMASSGPSVLVVWQVYALVTWLLGMWIFTGWLILRLRHLRRVNLRNQDQTVLPEWFAGLLTHSAERLKLRRIPKVVLTNSVITPAVFGLFRPVLLMPADRLAKLSRQDAEHILLHELAHIKRGDLLVHGFYILLQTVYWFNPLLWLVRRQMQHLRELCCDATVARILRERTSEYRDTLLETARELLAKPVEPGLGLLGLFEDSSRLLTRLRWLEKKTWRHHRLRIAIVCTIITLMSACVLPMAKSDIGSPALVIKGTVTDSLTGQPIAGAKVGDVEKYADGQQLTTTDSNGNYIYKTWYEEHGVKAEADGYKRQDKGFGTKLFGNEKEKVIDFALVPENQPSNNPDQASRILKLRIVHSETEIPLEGAALKIGMDVSNADNKVVWAESRGETDQAGCYGVEIPDVDPKRITIKAQKEGFVSTGFHWNPQADDLPTSFTLSLAPATSIGVVVQNNKGEPIPNVHVEVWIPAKNHVRYLLSSNQKTDSEGRWRCDSVPADLDGISFNFSQKGYAAQNLHGRFGKTPVLPIGQLRNHSAVITLQESLKFAMRVVGGDNATITNGAVLTIRDDTALRDEIVTIGIIKKPNNPGEFVGSFDEENRGRQAVLVAKAPGWALSIKEINLPPDNTPVEFTLGPARTITGRVVDEQQNPIARAHVSTSKWGKYNFRYRKSGWFTYTDPNGYFSWTEAPEDELDFSVVHEKYMWNYIKMAPSGKEYIITLKPAIRIRGTVTDAKTGKPIEKFRLFPAEYMGRDINFQRIDAKLYTNGQFDFNYNSSYNSRIIAIEAEGYKAVVSVPLIVDKGDFVYNFQLHKTTGIDDLVRFPDYLKTEEAKKFLAGTYFIEESQKALMLEKLKQNNKQIEKKFQHVNNMYEGDFVLDKDIPIELCAGTSDNPYIITAESVRFKKLDNKYLIAYPKLRIISWPKFECSMKGELLDANGKVLYVGRSTGGNSGIIFGIPFETHRTGRIELGRQTDISTVKRFKITIYPLSVSDKDARVVKKFFAHIDHEIGKLVSQYPQLADWDTVKTDSSWHIAGKKVTDERITYSHALLPGISSNYADSYERNGCRIQISVYIKETWNRLADYGSKPNVFVLKMGNFFVVAIVRTKKPEVPELEQKINDIIKSAGIIAIQKTDVQVEDVKVGSKLEFRVAVERKYAGLSKKEIAQLENEFRTNGLKRISKGEDKFQWFEARSEKDFQRFIGREYPRFIVCEYQRRKYVLLYDQKPYIMLSGTGWGLQKVEAVTDPMGNPAVAFEFDKTGAALFGTLTASNLQKSLAIVIDDKVHSAPTVQAKIQGKGQISGRYSEEEVSNLVNALRIGMPPIELVVGDEKDGLKSQPVSEPMRKVAVGNKARLRSGLEVELLGLTYLPMKGQPWWKPDGSPLVEPPFDRVSYGPVEGAEREQFSYHAIAMRLKENPEDKLGLIKWQFTNADYAGSTSAYLGEKRMYNENILAAAARFPKNVETTTLQLGIASGEWQTLAAGRHHGFYKSGNDSIVVGEPLRGASLSGIHPRRKGLYLGVTYNVTDRQFRVIAIDKNGNVHYSTESGSGGTKNLRRTNAVFPGLTREQLKEYRFEVRPYEWVEFKDIVLRPDKDADAIAERKRIQEQEQIEKWLGRGQTRHIRKQILVLRECRHWHEPSEAQIKVLSAMRELVRIGSPAVPELTAELQQTEKRLVKRMVAFVLRAIGDPKVVPVLIDLLGQNRYSGSTGFHVRDDELARFMLDNQHRPPDEGSRKAKAIILGCPVMEITSALEKITGHSEGHGHYGHKAVSELGRHASRDKWEQRTQEIVREVAEKWRKWWQRQNSPENFSGDKMPQESPSAKPRADVTVSLAEISIRVAYNLPYYSWLQRNTRTSNPKIINSAPSGWILCCSSWQKKVRSRFWVWQKYLASSTA